MDETSEYIKIYDNCLKYCGCDKFEDCSECVDDLKKTYGDDVCVSETNTDCEITSTGNFKNLLFILILLIQFIYCIRSKYGNIYDRLLILSISKINLSEYNLSISDLSCIEFPGDDSFVSKFPHSFDIYLLLIQQLSLEKPNNKELLNEYKSFIGDYQPWTRTLVTFLNMYGKDVLKTYFAINKIPNIENISKYGKFADKQKLYNNYLLDNISNSTFQIDLIHFLKIKTKIKKSKTKKSKKSKKSKTKKSKTKKSKTKKSNKK